MTNAEKVYFVGIGDGDKHCHIHLILKMPNDPNLWPYIFGGNGWAPKVESKFEEPEISKYVNILKTKA